MVLACLPAPTSLPSSGLQSATAPASEATTARPPSPAPATRPPGSITENVNLMQAILEPLPADEQTRVRVTAADASNTVLANKRKTGWPDPDIAWKDGGCVLLAWYQPIPTSYAPDPGPPSAVYLVRLVDAADSTMGTWVTVDATTGDLQGAGYGPSTTACPGLAGG
jgi:hypothetical protein